MNKDIELYTLIGGVFSFLPVAGTLIYFGQRWHQVLCPYCGESLMTHYTIVLATGKCTNCQKPVFDASP